MPDRQENAIAQLTQLLNLSEDALDVAEGWSILPVDVQRHFKLLINEYVANLSPILTSLYSNARESDQRRFNRIVERAQARRRKSPPDTT